MTVMWKLLVALQRALLKTHRLGAILIACIVLSPARAEAEVLHDQRQIATSGAWNVILPNFIGAQAVLGVGTLWDSQAADDFQIVAPAQVTRVVVDGKTTAQSGDGAVWSGGWLVEVFADELGHPAATPTYSATSFSVTHIGSPPPGAASSGTNGTALQRHTFAIEVSGLTLGAGTWWISVQPVDLSVFGDSFALLAIRMDPSVSPLIGGPTHARNGWVAHGNTYCCGAPAPRDGSWAMVGNYPNPGALRSDLSFSIEGTFIAGASGACCTGTTCAIVNGSAECTNGASYRGDNTICSSDPVNPTTCCPANFNGAGGLGVQDIFDFLAAYFANEPAADFNGAGGLSVQDIFDFLAAYFAGCA